MHAYKNGLKRLKLSQEKIDEIRKSESKGIDLSEKYGISVGMVSLIRNNKTRIYGY